MIKQLSKGKRTLDWLMNNGVELKDKTIPKKVQKGNFF